VTKDEISLFEIVEDFGIKALSVRPIRGGLINETYAVRTSSSGTWILQAVNSIFPPEVQDDIHKVTEHLRSKGLKAPKLRPTTNKALWLNAGGKIWRMMTFIEGVSVNRATSKTHAKEAGRILGEFHFALRDFEHSFHHQRPNIHNTAHHMTTLSESLEDSKFTNHDNRAAVVELSNQIQDLFKIVNPLPEQEPQIVHGDPKISNIRFNRDIGKAVCLVDLDTVGPMGCLEELGDAFRSWCNPAPSGEDEQSPEFSLEMFEAAVTGYATSGGGDLSSQVSAAIPDATLTICLELAARFANDALHESYFGWNNAQFASRGEHNLIRCRGQLNLARSLSEKIEDARNIVATAFKQ